MTEPLPPLYDLSGSAEEGAPALSVGELSAQIRDLLQGTFSRVRVHGEIVGLARPGSGHIYFSLKDDSGVADAKISAVLWRDRARRLRLSLEDGLKVTVEGRISVFEPRGVYQIVVDQVSPAGRGALLVALERLKEKLQTEGLFDPARKRPLPFLPRCIGLITSPSGAAVRDVLQSLHRKFPSHVRIFPVRVQGEGSATEIVAALKAIARQPRLVDAVILARGGGSLEDLWTFNEEKLVRAVASCPVPTISGVGHEADGTLVDLVADVRAQTPTHAGDLVVPNMLQLAATVQDGGGRLRAAGERQLRGVSERLADLRGRYLRASPEQRIRLGLERLQVLSDALKKALYNRLRQWEDQLLIFGEKLDALSPLRVLGRGYSLVRTDAGEIVRQVSQLLIDQRLRILLGEGEVDVRIVEIHRSDRRRVVPPRPEEETREL